MISRVCSSNGRFKILWIRISLSSLLLIMFILSSYAGVTDTYGSVYSKADNRIMWFIQISDIHMGESRMQAGAYLDWIVRGEGKEILHPEFIVATGDLTDSTNGGSIPDGPHIEEWRQYLQVLGLCLNQDCSEINETLLNEYYKGFYYDIPGNHDQYNDANFSYYLHWSVRGLLTSPAAPVEERTQPSWSIAKPFGKYHFISVNTAGDDGAAFSLDPRKQFGDHAGLRGENSEGKPNELRYIETELKNSLSNMTIIFGHHPIKAHYKSMLDTGFLYGVEQFVDLLKNNGVSEYGFGHTHNSSEAFFKDGSKWSGVFYLNAGSLGKSDEKQYSVVAIDSDGVSAKSANYNEWPVVLITTPIDKNLGGENPYAYTVPDYKSNVIRALIFSKDDIAKDVVKFRYSATPLSLHQWHEISADKIIKIRSLNGKNSFLWEAEWDASGLSHGDYVIEVEAKEHSHRVTVELIPVGYKGPNVLVFNQSYERNGNYEAVGGPINPVHQWGKGYIQDFNWGSGGKGALMLRDGTNTAYWVHGLIWEKYENLKGATGPLGYPLTDESEGASSSITGARNRYNDFEGGSIEHHANGPRAGLTVWLGHGIKNKWETLAYGSGLLGLPITDERNATVSPFKTSGKLCDFEGGHIYWHGSGSHYGQAFETHGGIDDYYKKIGGTGSWLGFPVSDQYVWNNYPRSDFEGGYITTPDGINFYAYSNSACPYTLTVKINPVGGGVVTKDPDKTTYCPGELIILNADANPDYKFNGWSGVTSKNGSTATVKIKANQTVTAKFSKSSESVSAPSAPSGAAIGTVGVAYNYSTGGSSSSLGHPVEYQFDWMGNGTDLSPWGSGTQSKKWDTPGTYHVRAMARCSITKSVISDWSSALPVSIGGPSAGMTMSAQGKTAYENQTLNLTVLQNQTVNVSFSASRSFDPDGSVTSYQWYINGQPVSTNRDFNFDLGEGTHLVYLEVWDDLGAEGAVGASVSVSVLPPPQGVINLPQTGQTTCYDPSGYVTNCDGTGQDGQIQAGVPWPSPRFSDHGDGTITDNLTGLMWTMDANLPGSYKTWIEAVDYVAAMNSNNNFNHNDWRLPNINELESLTNAGEPDVRTWLAKQKFVNVQSGRYWSSTTDAYATYFAWVLNLLTNGYSAGYLEKQSKLLPLFVWPVRSIPSGSLVGADIWRTGQTQSYAPGDDGNIRAGAPWPSARFTSPDGTVPINSGLVLDQLTGLTWTKDAYSPGPPSCNPAKDKLWGDALAHVACLNSTSYLGYSDWRLPNRKEILSLIDRSQYSFALPAGHPFVNLGMSTSSLYWTSTTNAWLPQTVWGFDIADGSTEYYGRNSWYLRIWPVRGPD